MQQNATDFRWSRTRDKAALLVAEDELSDEQIAEQLGINRATLHRWKKHPEFKSRIEANLTAIRAAILQEGIAVKANRVKALNERHRRMIALMDARAAEHQDVAGGETGLLVREVTYLPGGQKREVYAFDAALDKALRDTEKQAAQEVGQWVEKGELTGKDGKPLAIKHTLDLGGLSDEELTLLERVTSKLAKPGRDPMRES